ncbi:CoA transferase [Rhodococcus opacus]|uniref:CoA transferase n=1 Tax=Rhodococcus opacus TaxID=37919 RepID=UPI0021F2C737|nr:CoA transferase [Rhodococcus opacus]
MLSDTGAEVLRVDRVDSVQQDGEAPIDLVNRRGRRSVAVDLEHPQGAEVGFAPGRKRPTHYRGQPAQRGRAAEQQPE